MNEKKNIYQKLLEVRKQVQYLKKEASGFKYQYVKESQVLSAIRPKMDELGLLLEVDMMKPEAIGENMLNIGFNFVWINCDNPEEKIAKTMYLQCVQGDPKLIGGLLSYVNRYYLTKTFQIATDDLDIDKFQSNIMDTKKIADPRISEDQLKQIEDLINGHHSIRHRMNKAYGSLSKIKESDFDTVVTAINKLISDIEASNEKV